jgi:hypothetical protein
VLALVAMTFGPVALAQTDTSGSDSSSSSPTPPAAKRHGKKKGAKPAASASAAAAPSDSASAEPPPAAPPTTPEPEASASLSPAPSATPSATAPLPAVPNTPPEEKWDITNTREDPAQRYLFLGFRYRGTIVPQFFENLFVDDGATFYSNSFALELDIRKGGQSTIPWIEYVDYTTGNVLFQQKGQNPTDAAFYSVVKSSLKGVYAGLDERWSVPLVPDKLDYEYGFGVGIGAVFGQLHDGWVYQTASGPLSAKVNGTTYYFTPCTTTMGGALPPIMNGRGCAVSDHQNATVAQVNGYVEPNWFNGGAVPTILPEISIVPLGLRYKPLKMLEMRAALGIQLTGFFFSLSADYGFEQKPQQEHKASRDVRPSDTL